MQELVALPANFLAICPNERYTDSWIMEKARILVVDDDHDIVSAIDTILTMESYGVLCAFTGKDSIHQAKKNNPDLILLDYMLPDMNGKQIVEILRKDTTLHTIPIILISAAHNIEEIAKTMAIQACITKPFELENLLTLVEKYTKLHQQRTIN